MAIGKRYRDSINSTVTTVTLSLAEEKMWEQYPFCKLICF